MQPAHPLRAGSPSVPGTSSNTKGDSSVFEAAFARLPPFTFSTVYSSKQQHAAAAVSPSSRPGASALAANTLVVLDFHSRMPARLPIGWQSSWLAASQADLERMMEADTVYFQPRSGALPGAAEAATASSDSACPPASLHQITRLLVSLVLLDGG